jgi:hypothetical protein
LLSQRSTTSKCYKYSTVIPTTKTTNVARGTPAEVADSGNGDDAPPIEDDLSPGVARIAAINRNLTRGDRIGVFIGVFLIAYAYGLDGTIRSTYQVHHQQSSNLLRLSN